MFKLNLFGLPIVDIKTFLSVVISPSKLSKKMKAGLLSFLFKFELFRIKVLVISHSGRWF
ncbi:hypothetical protein EA770_18475 [Acinetobacter baumannii]|nr:hypothetical protein EA770_18475 [Acinetobacter baumannii]